MINPLIYPYVRVQTYSDANPPAVLSEEFYNPTEDALARLYGSLCGLSTSMACDEFDKEINAASPVVLNGQVGTDFLFQTATNASGTSVAPPTPGDHGVWALTNNVGAAAHNIVIVDAPSFVDTQQFIWSCRIRPHGVANFETRVNEGLVVGLWNATGDNKPAFRWGSDVANWYAYYNDGGDQFIDTGVAVADDTWYNLIINRLSSDNKIRYYIGTGTTAPTLVATSGVAVATAFSNARRFIRCRGTGASAAGDGFRIDYFKRGILR